MSGTVSERYASMVEAGEIAFDPSQASLAARLSRLSTELVNRRLADKQSHLGWLFAKRHKASPIKGLYVWGEVGRGKTMLVDAFFEATDIRRKRRVHFSDFMADVHARIHDWRQKLKENAVKGDDPIPSVGAAIAANARLLCVDEFRVEDIADAMILGRLFTRMFDLGLVLVTTSNVAPDDLYANGLNRALFLPFIGLLKQRTDVVCLDARLDYRLGRLRETDVYFTPLGVGTTEQMNHTWKRLTGMESGSPTALQVMGRELKIPRRWDGIARFAFADLCEAPLGANDFAKIASTFHTVFVDDVPRLKPDRRNEARRFVLLIDTLYDHGVKLIVSAEAEPNDLYTEGDSAAEFKRAASRLFEMRSRDYLERPHQRALEPVGTVSPA